MKSFKSHKIVSAALILAVSSAFVVTVQGGEEIPVNEELANRISAGDYVDGKGYLVAYYDNDESLSAGKPDYYSVSPKEVFESGYMVIKEKPNYDVGDTMRQGNPDLPKSDIDAMKAIKKKGQELIDLLETFDSSREMSLAKTKTEEAVFWAVKSVTA